MKECLICGQPTKHRIKGFFYYFRPIDFEEAKTLHKCFKCNAQLHGGYVKDALYMKPYRIRELLLKEEQLLYFTEAMESSIADMVFSPECKNCNIITDNFIKFKSKLKDIEDDFQLRELQEEVEE